MVPLRQSFPALLILCLVLSAAPVHAAVAAAFIPLGVDPAGDSLTPDGKAPPGTLKVVDVVSAGIATVGSELQFKLGLVANSETAGSYCWAMGFQKGTTEMFPVICAEFAGGTLVGQVGWTTQVSSSRGTQVSSTTGEFVPGGIVMHIPLADAGLKVGDKIDDIYGLTYVSRALNTADTIPDAKSDKTAAANLGSYVIGSATAGSAAGPLPSQYQNVTTAGFSATRSFANATTQSFRYNWTQGPASALAALSASVKAGNLTVVVRDAANHTLFQRTAANGTANQTLTGSAGTWHILVNATGFKGNFTLAMVPLSASTATTTATTGTFSSPLGGGSGTNATTTSSSSKGTPSPGLPVLLAGVGLALALRRRR
ncbi:MAG TPA: hypothetical protein VM286_08385 [Candidatus Thermoplasmatota archaeon]|nr:hypothetical protein [Candidatus Thermoplasmatota archaeon]